MNNIRENIAHNLHELRIRRGLTQFELAEKFHYSDKAISKWENGDTLPDVEVLYNLCEFYGVTIDYLTHEDNYRYIKVDTKAATINRISIICLVSLIIWTLATVLFVFSIIRKDNPMWQAYIWAVPANAVLLNLLNRAYFRSRITYFVCWSVFVWTLLAAIFLTIMDMSLWPIFILGVPAQAALTIWWNLKRLPEKSLKERM